MEPTSTPPTPANLPTNDPSPSSTRHCTDVDDGPSPHHPSIGGVQRHAGIRPLSSSHRCLIIHQFHRRNHQAPCPHGRTRGKCCGARERRREAAYSVSPPASNGTCWDLINSVLLQVGEGGHRFRTRDDRDGRFDKFLDRLHQICQWNDLEIRQRVEYFPVFCKHVYMSCAVYSPQPHPFSPLGSFVLRR